MMNDNRMKRQIQHSINTRLSGLQPDPWLAQRFLAGEEKNMVMKRSYKVSTIILVATLIAVLLAGTAFAAARLFLVERYRSDQQQPRDGAEALVQTDLVSDENDMVRFSVDEAIYDGHSAAVRLTLAPVNAERYVLLNDALQDTPEGVYSGAEQTPEGRNHWLRSDGKTVLQYSVSLSVDSDGAASRTELWRDEAGNMVLGSFGSVAGNYYFDEWGDVEENQDGSVELYTYGTFEEVQSDKLAVTAEISVRNGDDIVYQNTIPFIIDKVEDEETRALTPVGGRVPEDFHFVSATYTRTKLAAYIELTYTSKRDYSIGLWFEDADGNRSDFVSNWNVQQEIDAGTEYYLRQTMVSPQILPDRLWMKLGQQRYESTFGEVEFTLSDSTVEDIESAWASVEKLP